VTPVQWKAAAVALIALLAALGIQLASSKAQLLEALVGVAGPLFASIWVVADAHIRHGRSMGDAIKGPTIETTVATHTAAADTTTRTLAPTPTT